MASDWLTMVADKRLWGAVGFAFSLYWAGSSLVALTEPPTPAVTADRPLPTRPSEPEEGPSADLRRAVNKHRVPVIHADGTPAGSLLTPLQASAAFGGLVMLVGGVGAVWLWRRADPAVPDEPEGVVRNSAIRSER